jgi:hypothetical protein
MGSHTRRTLGWLLLVLGVAGCAASSPSGAPAGAPTAATQQDCERGGGIWRGDRGYCERAGGGGY